MHPSGKFEPCWDSTSHGGSGHRRDQPGTRRVPGTSLGCPHPGSRHALCTSGCWEGGDRPPPQHFVHPKRAVVFQPPPCQQNAS